MQRILSRNKRVRLQLGLVNPPGFRGIVDDVPVYKCD